MASWLGPILIAFKKYIMSYLVRIGLAAYGPYNYLASLFVNYVLKKLQKLVENFIAKKKVEIEINKELKEYKKEIEKPNATPEEIRRAGKEFLEG